MSAFLGFTPVILVILLAIAPSIFMIFLVLQIIFGKKNEAQRNIVEKTCTYTLSLYTLNLIFNVICQFLGFDQTINSNLTNLLFIGILFIIIWFFVKTKYEK
ncbi:hypothetical protein AN641_09080 [Candidatus Epulonipiscioides gigas]|nr:hypothetical protein AN641_09080 [Epulopiscium sp. SCG-C07WGA-EpuloA2]